MYVQHQLRFTCHHILEKTWLSVDFHQDNGRVLILAGYSTTNEKRSHKNMIIYTCYRSANLL